MKLLIISLSCFLMAGGLIQETTDLQANFTEDLMMKDSVDRYEVQSLVEKKLVKPLSKKVGLKSSDEFMDKSGHKRKHEFYTVNYNFKNLKKRFIELTDKKEVFGDLVQMDGSLNSHICSYKVVYPDKEIFVRNSVLEDWMSVKEFVKKAKKIE